MAKQINWGILGLGKIAHTFASDLGLVDTANLNAVASRSLDKAKQFSKTYGSPKEYGSYEELVADPDVDVVYIATPHAYHAELTKLCLNHGKHVLCEKPMGMNAKEVEELIELAKAKSLFLMEGIWTRFIPMTQIVIELINGGSIGDLISVKADFGFKADFNPESRLFKKELGGGALLDIGLYPIYLSLLLFGNPSEIKAMSRMSESGIDLATYMLFNYENDSKAILECSLEENTPTEARIYVTDGYLHIHSRFHHSQKITLHRYGADEKDIEIPYKGNGYVHEIEHVHTCLEQNLIESPKLPLETSQDLINIIDRVKQEIGLSY